MAINYFYSVVATCGSKFYLFFSSGLNVVVVVDLEKGIRGQYLADKCCDESALTLLLTSNVKDLPNTHPDIQIGTRRSCEKRNREYG